MKLTKKQKQVFDFICEYRAHNGFSPSQGEIREHFGFKSLGTVQDYLRYLKKAGVLRQDHGSVRGLEPVLSFNAGTIDVPLLGSVAAGLPIEAIEDSETIGVPDSMLGRGRHFALTIEGQSMIEDGIYEGDIVLIQEQKTATKGETIVAKVDGEVTIKRYYQKNPLIELHPANREMAPILVHPHQEFEILGKLVGLLRKYS